MTNRTEAKGVALVTGGSAGIGAAYADRLASRGYDLILVARQTARLDAFADTLRIASGRQIRTIAANLASADGLGKVDAVLRDDAAITLLVNNAGIGATGPLAAADPDLMTRMIALNVTAPTRLAQSAVSAFRAREHGAIINISSIVAVAPDMLNPVYGASKAYVLALSQALQTELADSAIRVQAVLPGITATGFWPHAGIPIDRLPPGSVMAVENMVDAALAGFDMGEQVTLPALADIAAWNYYESARLALRPQLSATAPASRYTTDQPAAG